MNELEAKIHSFKEKYDIKKLIMFSGGYLEEQKNDVAYALECILEDLRNLPVAIGTGGTNEGLPQLVVDTCVKYGMANIGFVPECARDWTAKGLDEVIVVPPRYGRSFFGDETECFAKAADAMVAIGGGPGALCEMAQLMKINGQRAWDNIPHVPIFPYVGFGGVTDEYVVKQISNFGVTLQYNEPYTLGLTLKEFVVL
jgi:predicted Rossmann-fold nucleotide-binding protein